MDDREWMYKGWAKGFRMTSEWIANAEAFLDEAFAKVKGSSTIWCPCSRCRNWRRHTKLDMAKHLCKYGFATDYTKWTYHSDTIRVMNEVVRQRIKVHDVDANVTFNPEDPPEANTKPTIHNRITQDNTMAREVHGPNFDPSNQNLDGEIVTRVGQGKKHGRYFIGDNILNTAATPTLSQVRAKSTSSSSTIRTRSDIAHSLIEAVQAQLEAERAEWKMQAQEFLERQETSQQQMLQMFQCVQTLYTVIAQTTPQVQLPPPPMLFPPQETISTPGNKISACYKTKVVKNWDAISTIYSSDHVNGEGANTGAESAQDAHEQADDASLELPPKRQRTGDAILCMLEDMKTSFKDALKSTEPLPMPHVTPPEEIFDALQMIPDFATSDMLKSYGKLILNERLFQALMKLPMAMRKEWLLMLN